MTRSAARTQPEALTLAHALEQASTYWASNDTSHSRRSGGGCTMMPVRAKTCCEVLGQGKGGMARKLSSLGPSDGASLLVGLSERGLGRSSVASYYSAGRRMLALSGVSAALWPKPPKAPRQVRPPVDPQGVAQVKAWLGDRGWPETAELVEFLERTGLRVEVEALSGPLSLERSPKGRPLLKVEAGKGGHQRHVPFDGEAPGDSHEERFGGLTYEGHLRRINEACKATGVHLRPHDLRRGYAKRVYEANAKDLRVAQALLGHASPATTAGYIGVDYDVLQG